MPNSIPTAPGISGFPQHVRNLKSFLKMNHQKINTTESVSQSLPINYLHKSHLKYFLQASSSPLETTVRQTLRILECLLNQLKLASTTLY